VSRVILDLHGEEIRVENLVVFCADKTMQAALRLWALIHRPGPADGDPTAALGLRLAAFMGASVSICEIDEDPDGDDPDVLY
jgi:hypothetical protein